MRNHDRSFGRQALTGIVALVGALALAACTNTGASGASGKIVAVGAENEYANVISQIGGRYVDATAVMSNPNTDPHTFEANPQVAAKVNEAKLIVQNGLGYDDFMTKIESAAPSSDRKVIDVQSLLGLPDSTANPHLWYGPSTMPAVAKRVAADLSALQPAHKAYFEANVTAFDNSLKPWYADIAAFKSKYGGAPVATTEPVADYLLNAIGAKNMTPFSFQAAVMNGNDPSPQDVAYQQSLFTGRRVKAFVYNEQVTDTLTTSLKSLAAKYGIPVVGVYETMPTPGYTYQTWMESEVNALTNAVAHGRSASTL